MCTRFYIEPESEELAGIMRELAISKLQDRFLKAGSAILTSGEIRPSCVVPVIAPNRQGKLAVYPMRWGFKIPGHSLIVNARSETAAETPAFQEAWQRHRCIIPASWYYEWKHIYLPDGENKLSDKYMIQPKNSTATWICGLYRIEDQLPTFTVLTRNPAGELRKIHNRMPLMLPKRKIKEWVSPAADPKTLLNDALTDMVFEKCV